jgi:hypothetical protein
MIIEAAQRRIQEEARRTSIAMLPDIISQRTRGDGGVLQEIQA